MNFTVNGRSYKIFLTTANTYWTSVPNYLPLNRGQEFVLRQRLDAWLL